MLISKKERGKILQENFYHALAHNQPKVGMEDFRNSRNFHSTITSMNGKGGCNTSFDDVPANHKEAQVERRSMMHDEDPDEEEKEHDYAAEECDKIEGKELRNQLKSQQEFAISLDDAGYSASRFSIKYQDD